MRQKQLQQSFFLLSQKVWSGYFQTGSHFFFFFARCYLCFYVSLCSFGGSIAPVPIPVPVLQLWGRVDNALGVGLAIGMDRVRWTPHKQSRLVVLETDHWIMAGKGKEVNEAILKFVQE